ncbi:NAD(P)/FAD-dependent oxidoreductase [Cellulomonas carbonis]|uniref:FAD-dependent oxidoreductase n=1 Tax=Cellulomonas carbonis T26 TaxID=947969 RepID=A0A0A0BR30_9CELL|nr:FAD-dependent oxidoreductase [Cellulomonas carbonis]KGM10928.1 FAD-dependent oxidoreductase [Cellulomonas carbonis T26]GGC12887.1 oxidoreductase [Cellulomonas carbonis]
MRYVDAVPSAWARRALAGSAPRPFWWDDAARPEPCPRLDGPTTADLVVVGGGYLGLWTALRATEREPGRDVLVVEGRRVAWAASGRNGGFCSASLTHGEANGRSRFAEEMDLLHRLGRENLDAIEDTLARYGIDAGFERTGELTVATEPHQVGELAAAATARDVLLDGAQVRARVETPMALAGLWSPDTALVHPTRLAWGLRRACLDRGVRIVERTPAREVRHDGTGVVVRTDGGDVRARHAALATNAFPPLLRRVRAFVVPVHDHALMTRPLTPAERRAIGWAGREGLADAGNQFHYARLTDDDRVLWGGYDALYYPGGRIRPEHEHNDATYERLAEHFRMTFPQLEDVAFTHRWGGLIDTCSRFMPFFGTAHAGRVGYAAGFTGLGVASTRFAADVVLDLLAGEETERTALRMVRSLPVPFPPEPLATPAIGLTRWSIARADRDGGRRNAWLRLLDAVGAGFDS